MTREEFYYFSRAQLYVGMKRVRERLESVHRVYCLQSNSTDIFMGQLTKRVSSRQKERESGKEVTTCPAAQSDWQGSREAVIIAVKTLMTLGSSWVNLQAEEENRDLKSWVKWENMDLFLSTLRQQWREDNALLPLNLLKLERDFASSCSDCCFCSLESSFLSNVGESQTVKIHVSCIERFLHSRFNYPSHSTATQFFSRDTESTGKNKKRTLTEQEEQETLLKERRLPNSCILIPGNRTWNWE
jgi:hypothetical protein